MIKLFKLTNNKELSTHDRPFYPTNYEIKLVNNPEDADYILLSPEIKLYHNQINKYQKYKNKMVVWVNNDNPNFLDDLDGVKYKFVSQPTGKKLNYMCVPLVMTDHIKWHNNENFLEKCRNEKKIYDYCFMGQIYGNRKKLLNLKLDKYLLKQTGSIYVMDDIQKQKSIEKFLIELSRCKFSFCPRGTGSNSFRLYESLMVGTVPISTDVIEYPFDDETTNWDNFIIRGKMSNIDKLIDKSKNIDYNIFRKNGIDFWEKYCKFINMNNKIIDTIKNG